MRKKIGVFETEQQVIDCIRLLQSSGFTDGEMKVIAKDDEHSRRIEQEGGVHADEVQEIAEAGNEPGDADVPVAAVAGIGSPLNGNASPPGYPALLGGYGFWSITEQDDVTDTLLRLGLSRSEAKQCRDDLRGGNALVIVESDESPTLFDQDGGPDLSRLGIAEGIYRQCSASKII